MSVMTRARASHHLPHEVNLHRLPQNIRDAFHGHMDRADRERHMTAYLLEHARAANLLGIALPAGGVITPCGCPCNCGTVYDPEAGSEYLDGTVQVGQCPTCTDDHYQTGE